MSGVGATAVPVPSCRTESCAVAFAAQTFGGWLAWAARCRIPAMIELARTIRTHSGTILAAVELGLSNSKLEGLNSKI